MQAVGLTDCLVAFLRFKFRYVSSTFNIPQGFNRYSYIASVCDVSENYVRKHLGVHLKKGWARFEGQSVTFENVGRVMVLEGTMGWVRKEGGVTLNMTGRYHKGGLKGLVRSGREKRWVRLLDVERIAAIVLSGGEASLDYSNLPTKRVLTEQGKRDLLASGECGQSLESMSSDIYAAFGFTAPVAVKSRKELAKEAFIADSKLCRIRKKRSIYKAGFVGVVLKGLSKEEVKTGLMSSVLCNKLKNASTAEVLGADRSRRPLGLKSSVIQKNRAGRQHYEALSGSDVLQNGFSAGANKLSKLFCCSKSKALRVMRKMEKRGYFETIRELNVLKGVCNSSEYIKAAVEDNSGRYFHNGKLFERKVNRYLVSSYFRSRILANVKKVAVKKNNVTLVLP